MTRRIEHAAGDRFGYWTVIGRGVGKLIKCECICGALRDVAGYELRSGNSKSCGCMAYENLQTRFESKYTKAESGCWIWTSTTARDRSGDRRAQIRVSGKYVYAARVAYELYHGPIPDGLLALHKCDNPMCVNPDHLFIGTHQDNVIDAIEKGRFKHLENLAIYNDQRKNHA